jgi:hypothetical protein
MNATSGKSGNKWLRKGYESDFIPLPGEYHYVYLHFGPADAGFGALR